jgi:uncharacterized protein YodC (DUF2158 family)
MLRLMQLRIGNLVRHKSGGPIMMIDLTPPENIWLLRQRSDYPLGCVWTEAGKRKFAAFRPSDLQPVYADGSPRNYDNET